jgi:murein DD-endopeptidase MepM/ murein hydrolase activator NlpD
MATTNPLRMIGTDVVQPPTQRIPTDVTPTPVSREVTETNLAKAQELENSTRQIESQKVAIKVEGLQALQEQNARRLSNKQQTLSNIVDEVGGVITNLSRIEAERDGVRQAYQKQADAEAKQRVDSLDTKANLEVLQQGSDILAKARDTINEQGRQVAMPLLRRDLAVALEDARSRGMTDETAIAVQKQFSSDLDRIDDETFQRFYSEARTTSDAISSTATIDFLKQNASLFANLSSGVASTDPGQRQIVLTQLEAKLYSNPIISNLDPAGRLQYVKDGLSNIQRAVATGSEAYNAIQLKIQNTDTGLQAIQGIATAEEQGLITPDEAIINRGRIMAQYGVSESARGWTQQDSIKRETEHLTDETAYARAVDQQKIDRNKVTFGTQLEVGHVVARIKAGTYTLAEMDEGGFRNQVAEALNTYNGSEGTLRADRARIGGDGVPGTLQTERAGLVSAVQLANARLAAWNAATTDDQRVALQKQFGASGDDLALLITQNTQKIQGLDAEERQVSQRFQQTTQSLIPFGLQNGYDRQQEQYDSPEAVQARADMAKAKAEVEAEDRQGFNRGNTNAPQTPARPLANVQGVGFSPFEAGADVGVTGHWNEQRPGHLHAGLDLGVSGNKVGTPITAVTSGKVSFAGVLSGYGNVVIINDGKGHDQLYAHLNTITVKEGEVLRQGTRIGGMGGSGSSDGRSITQGEYVPHLHFEVRAEGGAAGTDVDPVAYLSAVKPEGGNGETGLGLPPTQGRPGTSSGWRTSSTSLPAAGVMNTSVGNQPPPGAYILSNGSWLVGNTLYYASEDKRNEAESRRVAPRTTASYSERVAGTPSSDAVGGGAVQDTHHSARPIRGALASMNRADYPAKNDPSANYGYGAIAEDHQFRRKLSQVADKLGIPAQWLADVIAFETGNTFDPSKSNNLGQFNGGRGCVGMIQFCYLDGRYDEVANMTRTQQLDEIYNYFKPNAGKMESVYDVWASVWAGTGEGYGGRGNEIAGSDISDGQITGNEYSRRLGSTVGRRYAHPNDRGDSAVHSKPVSGCPTCAQMQSAQSFAAHTGQ